MIHLSLKKNQKPSIPKVYDPNDGALSEVRAPLFQSDHTVLSQLKTKLFKVDVFLARQGNSPAAKTRKTDKPRGEVAFSKATYLMAFRE